MGMMGAKIGIVLMQKGEKMADRYGYIGIETLLNFCENSKDHAVTPNDFMRMPRIKMPTIEPERKKWVNAKDGYDGHVKCTSCFKTYDWVSHAQYYNFCPNCGADMKGGQE